MLYFSRNWNPTGKFCVIWQNEVCLLLSMIIVVSNRTLEGQSNCSRQPANHPRCINYRWILQTRVFASHVWTYNWMNLNTVYASNAFFHDIKESVFYVVSTKLSLVLKVIEAGNIETNENGAFLRFQSSRSLNATSICCYGCTTTGDSLFMYVNTPYRAYTSFLSLDSSTSKSSDYSIYFSEATASNVNITRIETYSCPGIFLFGLSSGISNVSYYTISNAFTAHGEQISEAQYGHQTWQKFNTVNCSNYYSKFKNVHSVTFLRSVVFVGNWHPSGAMPIMIWRAGGTVTVEDMIIQNNGTMNGVSSGFVKSNNPKTIDMILANRMHCRVLISGNVECTIKGLNPKYLSILFFFHFGNCNVDIFLYC